MNERTIQAIQAIKNREEIPKKYISASKLLSFNGMSDYKYVCCNRLSEYIDDKHIMIDLFSDNGIDIVLDDIGINECESVLKGYISSEKLQGYRTYIRLENEVIESQNMQIKAIGNCPIKTIKQLLKRPGRYFNNIDKDKVDNFSFMLRTELKARRLHNKAIHVIKNLVDKIIMCIKKYRMARDYNSLMINGK